MSWLHDDLSRPLDAPLTSDVTNRSATRLALVVAQFAPEFARRYRRRDLNGDDKDETFCNFFVVDVARAMGCPLPQVLANDLFAWLNELSARSGPWRLVEADEAQRRADEGQFVVAGWFNRNGGSGHVAVLVPSLGEDGVWVAQAGLTNFLRGPVASGFGSRPVAYFAHP